MTGDNNYTQDLTLEGLDDDLNITMDDINSEENLKDLENKNNISEENKNSLENVAGKDDLDKGTLEKSGKSTSPAGIDKLPELYSSLASHFKKEGVLPNLADDVEIKTAQDLQKAIANEISKNAGELQAEYKKAMEEGVPKDSLIAYQQQKQQLNAITDEVLEADDERAINLRFNIIAQDFLNKGFSKEEASRNAKRSVDLGEDLADAKVALERLKESNENNYLKSKEEAQQVIEEDQKKIKKFIDSTEEIFKGIKLNPIIKEKLYNQMVTTVASKDDKPLNEYAKAYNEDPVKFQVMQNYMFMLTKGYTDFSKINGAATTKVSKEIDEILKTTGTSFLENGLFNAGTDINSKFSIGDEFDIDA